MGEEEEEYDDDEDDTSSIASTETAAEAAIMEEETVEEEKKEEKKKKKRRFRRKKKEKGTNKALQKMASTGVALGLATLATPPQGGVTPITQSQGMLAKTEQSNDATTGDSFKRFFKPIE